MVSLGDGVSTCREHGGRFIGPPAALAHLREHHAELVDRLARVIAIPLAPGDNPRDVIDANTPNRAHRRARKCRR